MRTTYKGYTIVAKTAVKGGIWYEVIDPDGKPVEVDRYYHQVNGLIDNLAWEREVAERERENRKQLRAKGIKKPKKPILTEFIYNDVPYELTAVYRPSYYSPRQIDVEKISGLKKNRYSGYKVWVNGLQVDADSISIKGFRAVDADEIAAQKERIEILNKERAAIPSYGPSSITVGFTDDLAVVSCDKDLTLNLPLSFKDGVLYCGSTPYAGESEFMPVLAEALGMVRDEDAYYGKWFRSQDDLDRYNDLGDKINTLRATIRFNQDRERSIVKAIIDGYAEQLAEYQRALWEWESAKRDVA